MKWLFSMSDKAQIVNTMKILLVDDHSILLDGLKKLIEEDESECMSQFEESKQNDVESLERRL